MFLKEKGEVLFMAEAQPKKKQSGQRKSTAAKTNKVEPVVEEVITTPKIYYIPLYFKREPLEKDVHVADYIYKEATNELSFFEIVPTHSAKLEGLMEGDVCIQSKDGLTNVSRYDETAEWAKNLHIANEFSGNPYYAGVPLEDYEAE
tara:strand:- start:115 stop:555 length:441 start_codon:yes stop_codon:yes gene_type:complete